MSTEEIRSASSVDRSVERIEPYVPMVQIFENRGKIMDARMRILMVSCGRKRDPQ